MFYHKINYLRELKPIILNKKDKDKENRIYFDEIYKNENTLDLKKINKQEKKEKIKISKENNKSIKNLDEWYSNVLNNDCMIEKYKSNMNSKVKKMIRLICSDKIKQNLTMKIINESLPKIKNLPQIKNEGLQKLKINKYNTELIQNIIKKGLLRDIRKKSISYTNNNQGFKLIERRSKSLINNYNSLKNSVKLGHIDSSKIIKKMNEKLLPKIKKSIFSENKTKNNSNLIILGKFRFKNEKDKKKVNKLKINRMTFRIEKQNSVTPMNNLVNFSAKIEKIKLIKESISKIREINKKMKKKIEKLEINLFKMAYNGESKILDNRRRDSNIVKFNKMLFQGKNIETKRLELKKNKMKIKNKKNVLRKILLESLRNLKYFKLINKRIKYKFFGYFL